MVNVRGLSVVLLLACKGTPASPPPGPGAPVVAAASPTDKAAATAAASTVVRVDRRVELLSILHRLIGHQAYTRAPATPYVAAVEARFRPFADHPAVVATRALRASHSITWDAPMILAAHLDDQLQLVNAEELPSLDVRFTGADVASYAATLREFAEVTKLDEFLASQQPYVATVEATVRTLLADAKAVPWFDGLFGVQPRTRYVVVPGLLTGTRNFAARATLADGTHELYQVLGIHAADGLPATDAQSVALLVHEMAHSYVNPVTAAHRAALEPGGAALFAGVADLMKPQAYDRWSIFVDESIVRAVVVRFVTERAGEAAGQAEIATQERLGFRWTRPLVEQLARYQRERATYPDLAAFMPEIAKALAALAAQP